MRKVLVSLCFLALAVALPAGAQSQPKTIARINTIKVKPGEGQQWEAGTKRLNAWKRQENGPATTYIWSVISGGETGEYVEGSFGHDWKDFDAGRKRAVKDGFGKEVQATVVPYTELYESSYYAFQPDLSSPVNPNQPPTPMSEVTFFTLKPGGLQPVVNAIKQTNAAMGKTHWKGVGGSAEWYVLVSGGEGPQIFFSIGLKNYAAMQSPSMSVPDMLVQAYGKAKAQTLEHTFNSHVQSEYSELISYRPDLSYIAASQ
jgi:hypothetical protein